MDKIILKGLAFYGYHGLFQEERVLGQRFIVDLDLYVPLERAGRSDRMEDSVHYGEVFNVVKQVVEGEPHNLLESVSETIASELLEAFPEIEKCRVRFEKPNPPINGHYDSVSVEIVRGRKK